MPDYFWIQEVVFPLVGMGIGGFALYGIYLTVNRVLDRRHELRTGPTAGLADEVGRLRARLDELEDQTVRLQELEERLDFAERMLAQQGGRPMIGGDH